MREEKIWVWSDFGGEFKALPLIKGGEEVARAKGIKTVSLYEKEETKKGKKKATKKKKKK